MALAEKHVSNPVYIKINHILFMICEVYLRFDLARVPARVAGNAQLVQGGWDTVVRTGSGHCAPTRLAAAPPQHVSQHPASVSTWGQGVHAARTLHAATLLMPTSVHEARTLHAATLLMPTRHLCFRLRSHVCVHVRTTRYTGFNDNMIRNMQ